MNKEFESKQEYEEPLFKNRELDKGTLNVVIAEHMFRSGNYISGEMLCEEANINMTNEFKNQFKELNFILKDL